MIGTLIFWLSLAGILAFVASAVLLRSYTRFARRARGAPSHCLPRGAQATPLDRLVDAALAAHAGGEGRSGLRCLLDPKDAFAARSLSAAEAGRSLDLIYYIWKTDTSGWLLMADLLAAADRGVRVRLLLDDINVQGFDLAFLGLNQHPNIEVRLFNPLRNRGHWIRRGTEFALGLSRFNRRMHGKVWIADGRLAILGGRNVGDTYFAAPGSGARRAQDADMVLVGDRVAQVESVFDSFWNLGLSLPILTLWPRFRVSERRFRRRLIRHSTAPLSANWRMQAIAGRSAADLLITPLRWTTEVTVLSDPPDKALGHRSGPWLLDSIADLLRNATQEICLTTPYFVPGAPGLGLLTDLAGKGIRVRVLTNSLSATDLFSVHAAYSHYRRPLLLSGAELYEFAPPRRAHRGRDFLHSKVFVIDRDRALVGSHNFDMRSAYINIELGLLFREATLVAELADLFDRQTRPDSAFSVTLEDGQLHWNIAEHGRAGRERYEPEASPARRAASWIIARLPHDWF